MIKNKKANEMRRLCSEYKRDNNLGLAYENFNLMEEKEEMHECCPKWAVYDWKEHNDKLTTIFLPEFMNRYSFVSSYAWLINSFFAIKGVKWRHGIQLLCVALLTPSQIQFHSVVRCLKNKFKPNNNLCFEHMKHCKKHRLIANGGPKSRFMAGKENELPNGIKEINKNVKLIEDAIKCLNNGEMLDKNGLFVDNKTVLKVKGIGPARAISFPSLCCFTGFGTSEYAIQTAKQAILNLETANGYAGDNKDQLSKLGKILRVDGDHLRTRMNTIVPFLRQLEKVSVMCNQQWRMQSVP